MIAGTIMRVLLAGRFRGNSNAAQLLEEEGEESLEVLDEEEKEEADIVNESSPSNRGQAQAQLQQAQTISLKSQKHQQEACQDPLILTGKENRGDNRTPHQLQSVPSVQQQAPLSQRKRRLTNSTQEENDCKVRRRQASTSSAEEDPPFLDRKPRARENGAILEITERKPSGLPHLDQVSSSIDNNTISREAPVPLTDIDSSPTKSTCNKMVSGGPRRNHHSQRGNPCQGEREEHLLNWQYNNNNQHPNHAILRSLPAELDRGIVRGDQEIFTEPSSSTSFDGLLENDPASARGDVSSSSPERQNRGTGYIPDDPASVVQVRNSGFGVGRRENSPSFGFQNSYELGPIASAPRIAPSSNPNRRDKSRIAPCAGSERVRSVLQTSAQNRGNGNNKKKASTPAEELRFRAVLKKDRGLEIREQDGDGNCLFRAISLQVYGDPSMHGDVRKQCMDHMVRHL